MRKRCTGMVALMFMGGVSSLTAQLRIFSPASERGRYARMLEAREAVPTFPLIFRGLYTEASASETKDSLTPWRPGRGPRIRRIGNSSVTVAIIPFDLKTQLNSKYPRGSNDGALWAGKGISGQIHGGVRVSWGPLTGTFLPTVYYTRNASFETAPVTFTDRSVFGYAWSPNIDLPQRFGADALTEYNWGQSGVRLNLGRFTAAFSISAPSAGLPKPGRPTTLPCGASTTSPWPRPCTPVDPTPKSGTPHRRPATHGGAARRAGWLRSRTEQSSGQSIACPPSDLTDRSRLLTI